MVATVFLKNLMGNGPDCSYVNCTLLESLLRDSRVTLIVPLVGEDGTVMTRTPLAASMLWNTELLWVRMVEPQCSLKLLGSKPNTRRVNWAPPCRSELLGEMSLMTGSAAVTLVKVFTDGIGAAAEPSLEKSTRTGNS